MNMNPFDVLICPVFSEKATILSDNFNKLTFLVARDATKPVVSKAFSHVYGVNPLSVHIINRKGKRKRTRQGRYSSSSLKKIAIVSLPKSAAVDVMLEV